MRQPAPGYSNRFSPPKPMDQGTGLGLTMVDMIMKAHNGFVLCESTPGTGTTFTLYLPAGNHDLHKACT